MYWVSVIGGRFEEDDPVEGVSSHALSLVVIWAVESARRMLAAMDYFDRSQLKNDAWGPLVSGQWDMHLYPVAPSSNNLKSIVTADIAAELQIRVASREHTSGSRPIELNVCEANAGGVAPRGTFTAWANRDDLRDLIELNALQGDNARVCEETGAHRIWSRLQSDPVQPVWAASTSSAEIFGQQPHLTIEDMLEELVGEEDDEIEDWLPREDLGDPGCLVLGSCADASKVAAYMALRVALAYDNEPSVESVLLEHYQEAGKAVRALRAGQLIASSISACEEKEATEKPSGEPQSGLGL